MIASLPPGLLLIVAALAIPVLPDALRRAWTVVVPAAGLWALIALEPGTYLGFAWFGAEFVPVRVDKLSLIFGYVFHIAAIVGAIYALHVRDTVQHVAGMMYAGSGIGAVFAGDLVTLFVYWEAMAITSVFLIWARGGETAYRSGMRYLIVQIVSGVLLLSGAILLAEQTGSIAFDRMALGDLATWLILLAFGIKCAFPFLHNWLPDAYPEATVTGAVFLSAFTTKAAVYALARGFPGTEMLIYVGAAMTAFPIFYAVMENDLRRTLAYSLNSQLGFMVVGVGIGTPMALNGAVGHAFVSTLYMALLFMSMGAVLYRVGTIEGSELGGLHKSMPFTTVFCIVGAASISAFPLFSGFIAKSLTLSAAAYGGYAVAWLTLTFASAGVIHHSGMKIPYFAFFSRDSGKRCKEAPLNMLIAMGTAAFLCIALGVWSPALYSILPHDVDYEPYTPSHVIGQLQLLAFAALAFAVLIRYRIYPAAIRSTNLDFDWTYRRGIPALIGVVWPVLWSAWQGFLSALAGGLRAGIGAAIRLAGPEATLARTWPLGSTTLWVAVLLGGFLLIYYL